MPESSVGKVEHYFPKVKAAAVRLTKRVKVGDKVHIVGHGDDFTEDVTSLQLDRKPIQEGAPGQSVGLWVKDRVHEGDDVRIITPEPTWSKPVAAKPKAKQAPKGKAKPARRPKAKGSRPKASRPAKPARKAAGKAPKRKAPARKAAKGARKKR